MAKLLLRNSIPDWCVPNVRRSGNRVLLGSLNAVRMIDRQFLLINLKSRLVSLETKRSTKVDSLEEIIDDIPSLPLRMNLARKGLP